MTNSEIWLDETLSNLKSIKSDLWMLHEIISMPNCNDCKRKDCSYKPKWGEHIRYNCPLHLSEAIVTEPQFDKDINVRSKTENSSGKPNNCEHITEDGVTCAKYPACDDCLDNPLNKVKGSKRLLKGKDEPQIEKCPFDDPIPCEWVCTESNHCKYKPKDEPQTERSE